MPASLAVVPAAARPATTAPLYVIEDWLAALIETAELVPPDREEEFRAELTRALETAVEKRDRVHQFLVHCETQAGLAKAEIDRLKQRKEMFERVAARTEEYIVATIESLGKDAKGKPRKLEGKTVTLQLHACPATVEITDETAVPAEHKTITVKMPAPVWEQVLDSLEIETRASVFEAVKSAEYTISKGSLKKALDAPGDVPGAKLVTGRHSLRRS
jgi:hypothetical protein